MNSLQTFIFIGRSGCGKGTQVGLLMDYLKKTGLSSEQNSVLHIETGQKFRELIAGDNCSSHLSKKIMAEGARQPDFLAVWIWSNLLMDNFTGNEHLIFDGAPRSSIEAQILDTAIKFYQRGNVHVIYLDVSNDWAKQRLMARGRADDKNLSEIDKRLAWFETDVKLAVKYYETNPAYHFVKVNGEQTIEKVHENLMAGLGI